MTWWTVVGIVLFCGARALVPVEAASAAEAVARVRTGGVTVISIRPGFIEQPVVGHDAPPPAPFPAKYSIGGAGPGGRTVACPCPTCGARYECELVLAGLEARCRTCGSRFTTPGIAELSAAQGALPLHEAWRENAGL
jgi:DNA-directed RNA polymerase subunit RPC12/RpoP